MTKEEAIKGLKVLAKDFSGYKPNEEMFEMAINSLTANVRENVQGKWIPYQNEEWIYQKCSECGQIADVKSNFCPSCGANMRGDKHEL